jgi:hypothetical protein
VALLLMPALTQAATSYTLTMRSLTPQEKPPAPVVAQVSVEAGKVRVDAGNGSPMIFRDDSIYSIDDKTRTVRVVRNATYDQGAARMVENLKQLRAARETSPPEKRAFLDEAITHLEQINALARRPAARALQATTRSESVDGLKCQVWEQHEGGIKSLELCVAAADTVPGASEIIAGLKELNRYPHGADLALGASLGRDDWWPAIEGLAGVPILIRAFSNDVKVSESTLTGMRQGVPSTTLFEIPTGYQEKAAGVP